MSAAAERLPQVEGDCRLARQDNASRLLPLPLLGLAVIVFLWGSWKRQSPLDDAFISYRYARNLVEGQGLVFNRGEYVEGFTNLLWTLLIAGGIALGLDAITASHILSLVSGAAVLWATYAYTRGLIGERHTWLAGVAPWIVLTSAAFLHWSTAGMETPLFTALVTLALVGQASGHVGWATAAMVLATLTRPEGVLVAAVILPCHLLSARTPQTGRWAPLLVYVICVVLLTAFRIWYYGSPLPNTFYAKVGGIPVSRGFRYALGFFQSGAVLLLLPSALTVFRCRRAWPGAALVAITTLYVICVGGDAFMFFRFLLPVLPCLAGLAVGGIAKAFRIDRRLGVVMATSLPGVFCWHLYGVESYPAILCILAGTVTWVAMNTEPLRRELAAMGLCSILLGLWCIADRASPTLSNIILKVVKPVCLEDLAVVRQGIRTHEERQRQAAEAFLRAGGPHCTVALCAIGAFGYYSRLQIVDMLGLLHPEVAQSGNPSRRYSRLMPGHQRSSADYVLGRKPDFIVAPRVASVESDFPAEVAVLEQPDFAIWYDWDNALRTYRRRNEPRAQTRSGRL